MSDLPKLYDDSSLQYYDPRMAKALGINQALFLQQLHYWIHVNKQIDNKKGSTEHFFGDHWWTYNTNEEWRTEHFPWMSETTLRRTISDLRDKGLIKTQIKFQNKVAVSQWFTIDYEALNAFISKNIEGSQNEGTPGQNDRPPIQNDRVTKESSVVSSKDSLKDKNAASPNRVPSPIPGLPLEPNYASVSTAKETVNKDYSEAHSLFKRLAYSDPKNNTYKAFKIDSSYAQKLQEPVNAIIEGKTISKLSPCELYETDSVFKNYIEFAIAQAWKYATKGKPSKKDLINRITNYNRADGWLWFEAKNRHFEVTDNQPAPVDLAQPL